MKIKPLSSSSKRRLFRQCQRSIDRLTARLVSAPISEHDRIMKKIREEEEIQRSFID